MVNQKFKKFEDLTMARLARMNAIVKDIILAEKGKYGNGKSVPKQ